VGRDRLPSSSCVRDCHDKPDLPPEPFCQRDALQLGSSQLRLKVAEATLNLDEYNRIGAGENHVRRSAIWRWRNRHLKADTPGGLRRRPNHLSEPELA
jgi:hypothetical protein